MRWVALWKTPPLSLANKAPSPPPPLPEQWAKCGWALLGNRAAETRSRVTVYTLMRCGAGCAHTQCVHGLPSLNILLTVRYLAHSGVRAGRVWRDFYYWCGGFIEATFRQNSAPEAVRGIDPRKRFEEVGEPFPGPTRNPSSPTQRGCPGAPPLRWAKAERESVCEGGEGERHVYY